MHLFVMNYELFRNFVAQNRKIDDYDTNIKIFFLTGNVLFAD